MQTCLYRGYTHQNILINSDGQAALKAAGKFKYTSRIVREKITQGHHSLICPAPANHVESRWVFGYSCLFGNEKANSLARQGEGLVSYLLVSNQCVRSFHPLLELRFLREWLSLWTCGEYVKDK